MESRSGKVIVTRERRGIEIPFTFKVGQVFTGFGIGCGVGIGVGRSLNLGAIPVLNQVMGATRGATDALSGVGRHVNKSLRKLGAKNIEAGIGCGVGFGHGFGIGLAVKPWVVNQIQSSLVQVMTKLMMKSGIAPNLSLDQGLIPASLQSSIMPSSQNQMGSVTQLGTKIPDPTSQSFPARGNWSADPYESFASKKLSLNPSYGTRTDEVIGSFLQNPMLKDEGSQFSELTGRLQSENNMLQMVLKNQQVIEDLMKENQKLCRILVEDLNIPRTKLQASYTSPTSMCADCFQCRRKQRKNVIFQHLKACYQTASKLHKSCISSTPKPPSFMERHTSFQHSFPTIFFVVGRISFAHVLIVNWRT